MKLSISQILITFANLRELIELLAIFKISIAPLANPCLNQNLKHVLPILIFCIISCLITLCFPITNFLSYIFLIYLNPLHIYKLLNWKIGISTMNTELKALTDNETWILNDVPDGKVPIGWRWVYKIKYHANGSIEQYKACLVSKGYTLQEWVNYFDTFSHVAKLTIVCLLLALDATHNWHLQQLNVKNAFIHGDLDKDVSMKLPPSVSSFKPNQVSKLLKSL